MERRNTHRYRRADPQRTMMLAVALLAVSFAGCVDPDDSEPDFVSGSRSDSWDEGQWWQYHVNGSVPASWMEPWFYEHLGRYEMDHMPILDDVDQAVTFIAVPSPWKHTPSSMYMATDDPETEFLSRFGLPLANEWRIHTGYVEGTDGYAYLGQMGQRSTQMFSWPFEDGKQWTTRFYGQELEITASIGSGIYEYEGRLNDDVVLEYGYDPEATWLSHLRILNQGELLIEAELLDYGKEYEGTYFFNEYVDGWACYTGSQGTLPATAPLPQCQGLGFDVVRGGHNSYWYNLAHRSEGEGVLTYHHTTPQSVHPELWYHDVCPCDEERMEVVHDLDPGRYEWGVGPEILSGDNRWSILWVIYRCFSEYKFEEGTIQGVDVCEIPESS